jgi:hypothetical protein
VAIKQNVRAYSALDVIDRVLDKGIVIDAMACVSLLVSIILLILTPAWLLLRLIRTCNTRSPFPAPAP